MLKNTENSAEELIHLAYTSRANNNLENYDIYDIIVSAQAKNKISSVTGLLVYNADSFIQILEGPKSCVEEIFKCIINDSRHYMVHTLFKSKIDHRSFPEWNMGLAFEYYDQTFDKYEGILNVKDEAFSFYIDMLPNREVMMAIHSFLICTKNRLPYYNYHPGDCYMENNKKLYSK